MSEQAVHHEPALFQIPTEELGSISAMGWRVGKLQAAGGGAVLTLMVMARWGRSNQVTGVNRG